MRSKLYLRLCCRKEQRGTFSQALQETTQYIYHAIKGINQARVNSNWTKRLMISSVNVTQHTQHFSNQSDFAQSSLDETQL